MPSNNRPSKTRPAPFDSLTSDELLRELDAMLAEVNRRAENYVRMGAGSAAALGEGLLFATKADGIIAKRQYSLTDGLRVGLNWLRDMSLNQTLLAEEVA